MIPSDDYPDLKYFLRCYFHQNWVDLYGSYEGVIEAFLREDVPERIARAKSDIDRLLALPVNAAVLSDWIDRGSEGGYDPEEMDGRSYLEMFRARIARAQS